MNRADWFLTRSAGLLLLCLGALPFSLWIPGGMSDPGYLGRWLGWAYGSAVCLGVGLVAGIYARRMTTVHPVSLPSRVRDVLARWPVATDACIALACGIVYALIARLVFDAKPLLIDEIVQVIQARMYAGGHLSMPVAQWPEFHSLLHVVDIGRFYSQFPPGWPALLALGTLVHAEWLVGPACGAVAVFAFARLLRRIFSPAQVTSISAGTLLFGLGPFAAFQFSSHMSHGPFLMWLVLASLGLTYAVAATDCKSGWRWGAVTGLLAGCAFAVRPLDGVAFGVVAAAWLVWRARRPGVPRVVLAASMAGLAIPVLVVMWVNVRTTGSPTEFGYQVLWGAAHGLGFHQAPWGDAHTPQRGVELLSLYATRLNVYLFETPFPSLLPVIVGLWGVARLSKVERFLLVGTGVHGLLYFAYWHDGFYLGPRFVTPWIPALILMCVRGGQWISRARIGHALRVGLLSALSAAGVLTAVIDLPLRVAQYRSGLVSMREDYGGEAVKAGVRNAIVFVHESWGAQLVARLWALGASRSATAALYSHVDACLLERAVASAERGRARGTSLERALNPLMRDSLLVRPSNVSPDTTERMLPGMVYDSTCTAQVMADRAGYALYPPFLLDNRSGNVYLRDFPDRDTLALRSFSGRPSYRVTRNGVDGTSPLVWIRLK